MKGSIEIYDEIKFIDEIFTSKEISDIRELKNISMISKEYFIGASLKSIISEDTNVFYLKLSLNYIDELIPVYMMINQERCSELKIEKKALEMYIDNMDVTDISNVVIDEYINIYKKYIDRAYDDYKNPFIFIKENLKFLNDIDYINNTQILKIPKIFKIVNKENIKNNITDISNKLLNECESIFDILNHCYKYYFSDYKNIENEFSDIIDLIPSIFFYMYKNKIDKDFDFNNYLKDIGFIKNKLDK